MSEKSRRTPKRKKAAPQKRPDQGSDPRVRHKFRRKIPDPKWFTLADDGWIYYACNPLIMSLIFVATASSSAEVGGSLKLGSSGAMLSMFVAALD